MSVVQIHSPQPFFSVPHQLSRLLSLPACDVAHILANGNQLQAFLNDRATGHQVPGAEEPDMPNVQKLSWKTQEVEQLSRNVSRQAILAGTIAHLTIKRGGGAPQHSHANEELTAIVSGALKYVFDDGEVIVAAGEVLVVPANLPHWVEALEDSEVVFFFSPARDDWFGEKSRPFESPRKTNHC
jgi:quercetin dioxygenase-like cupin family protein